MIRIVGSSVTSLVIASCLSYKNEDFFIDAESICINTPSVLWLEYADDAQKKLYGELFNIKNIEQYTKHVKIGYLYNDKIYDNASKEMIQSYLQKQHREVTQSCMSDGKSELNVILLQKIMPIIAKRYENKLCKNVKYDFTYDTIDANHLISTKASVEYLCKNTNVKLHEFDIVYDCNDSNVKRYTPGCIEYIDKPNTCCIEIPNYYASPKMYLHNNTLLIGRNATKTQFKQKDVIEYLLYGKGTIVCLH